MRYDVSRNTIWDNIFRVNSVAKGKEVLVGFRHHKISLRWIRQEHQKDSALDQSEASVRYGSNFSNISFFLGTGPPAYYDVSGMILLVQAVATS